jgi:hypothetical protein
VSRYLRYAIVEDLDRPTHSARAPMGCASRGDTEIVLLFEQRDTTVPLSERWQALAREKLADVERLIRHAHEVRQTLLSGLCCGCENLDECIDCVLKQCA